MLGGRSGGRWGAGVPTHLVSEVSWVNTVQKPVISDASKLGRQRPLHFPRGAYAIPAEVGKANEPLSPVFLPTPLGKPGGSLWFLFYSHPRQLASTHLEEEFLLPLELETLP